MAITRSTAILELSPAAYDEIEQKLLAAGYEHVFERGPGSLIDMEGIGVTRGVEQSEALKIYRDTERILAAMKA